MNRIAAEVTYRRARRHLELEEFDCQRAPVLPRPGALAEARLTGEVAWQAVQSASVGASIIGDGRVLKEIRGMGKVYDWRTSSWTPANGGRIRPVLGVQHIPVIRNQAGIGDFITLRNVLVAQGLMVQTATDREGNAALFTPFDVLCYHARGANQFSWGCEHMHLTTGEDWTRKQLRAAAWLVQLAKRKHGIPAVRARLGSGDGVVRVLDDGQTTHEEVSEKARYFDRSDPGSGYDFEYVRHCVMFFGNHGHFQGA